MHYYLFDYLFYFFKATKKHCRINMLGKAVSAGDGLGMKVPCRLPIFAEEKYVNLLKEKFTIL